MRRCGFSDKMFYYNGSGEQTYSMRLRYELGITLTREMLEEAAQRTIALFPDYRVRPVLKDGRVFYEENHLPVPVFWNDTETHYYGSDEVNGYLFVLSGEEHALTFSQYHGLTDFEGYWSLLHTLMKELMSLAGIDAEDPLVRTDSAPYDTLDVEEREDPYSVYANENGQSAWHFPYSGALSIPAKGDPRVHIIDLLVSEQNFLAKTREYGTSFVPLFAMLFSWAANDVYGIRDLPVVMKVPVNLRRLFRSRTTVNFSDSAVLCYPQEYLSLSRAEQGKALRENLNQQLNPGNFERVIARKVRTISGYEASGRSIEEINQSILGSASTSARPVTLGLTYIGRLDFPESYQESVTDIIPCGYTPTDGIFVSAMAHGGTLRIRIQEKYEHGDFIDALAKELSALGMAVRISEAPLGVRDLMDIHRLKSLP